MFTLPINLIDNIPDDYSGILNPNEREDIEEFDENDPSNYDPLDD